MGNIGILTFHWADDCGAMLQAYALRRRLELLGERAEIIPYAPVKLTGRYWLCPLWAVPGEGGLRCSFQWNLFKQNLLLGRQYFARRRHMRAFRHRYLTPRLPIRGAEKISLFPYKTVLIGSDQVWNPDITVDLDDAYIGNIPRRGSCRLVSYGASLGGNSLSPEQRQAFSRYVGEFSAVSLREQADTAWVGRLLGRQVRSVLDPVLLLERPEWERIAKDFGVGDAVVLYLTEPNEALLRCARALSAYLGKRIVSLSRPPYLSERFQDGKPVPGVDIRADAGPAEFLGCLRDACCVLTNSFHATSFSILLEKPFLTFPHSTRNLRLEDLLRKLGLLSHLTETDRPDGAMEIWTGTDWDQVRARLAAEREASVRFLMEAI